MDNKVKGNVHIHTSCKHLFIYCLHLVWIKIIYNFGFYVGFIELGRLIWEKWLGKYIGLYLNSILSYKNNICEITSKSLVVYCNKQRKTKTQF